MPLREVLAALDARYDPALAESWDAVGLVCGDPDEPVRRVLFAVDPTAAVVDEVLDGRRRPAGHPPPAAADPGARRARRRPEGPPGAPADPRPAPALFVAHTNADRAPDSGVNDALAAVLGLRDAVPLEPADGDPRAGLGRVGELDRADDPARVRGAWPPRCCRRRSAACVPPGIPDRMVRRVAVCGGSGGSLTGAAAAAGADVFLTSDLKHHPVSEAHGVEWTGALRRSTLRHRMALAAGRGGRAAPRPVRAGGGGRLAAAHRPVDVARGVERGSGRVIGRLTPGARPGEGGSDVHRNRRRRATGHRARSRRSAATAARGTGCCSSPIVVPLLVPLYNRVEPTLFGWPLFYWLQLLFVGARRG